MNGREKLTIAIPTFNRGEILKKCLNDLLKLNRSVVEILVVDNHSTDSTEKVCTELLEKQQISYFRNSANVGPGRNIFLCFLYAKSDNIMFIGDDDRLSHDYVGKVINLIETEEYSFISYEQGHKIWEIDRFKPTEHSAALVFMRSGTLGGNVYNRKLIDLSVLPPTDRAIYPQIATAMNCALKGRLLIVKGYNIIEVDYYSSIGISEKSIERPGDYGIGERVGYIYNLFQLGEVSLEVYLSCLNSLLTWTEYIVDSKMNLNAKNSILFIKQLILIKEISSLRKFFHILVNKFFLNNKISFLQKLDVFMFFSRNRLSAFIGLQRKNFKA
ncbi:MAG: hypothetical protein CME64_03915 [Halobacteriovoraceae bacterium]|nr:hypothetical protein [Halobacteriovoraceae bacterium]